MNSKRIPLLIAMVLIGVMSGLAVAEARVAVFTFKDRPLRFGLSVAAVMLALYQYGGEGDLLDQQRSFFGVYRVISKPEEGINVLLEYPVLEDLALTAKEEDLARSEVAREMSQKVISRMTEGF